MMHLDPVTAEMSEYQVADALKLSSSSHPDIWLKRIEELRSQGRTGEAEMITVRFADRLDDDARQNHEALSRILESLFEDESGGIKIDTVRAWYHRTIGWTWRHSTRKA